jgi:DNA topoisomerase-3
MKTVILTEKPSVAREFASALSSGKFQSSEGFIELDEYVITWAIGHLLTPYDPEDYDQKWKHWNLDALPIFPEAFKFKSVNQTKKQLAVVKSVLKRKDLDKIIVATDAGREGELIARLIINDAKIKLPGFRFFTSDALTRDVIKRELSRARPLANFDRLYIAGRARQQADWLVGMNLSRLATIKLNDLFSVGRVQTAVLGLIVDRRKEIDQFISTDYFEMKSVFNFKNGSIECHWFDPSLKTELERKKSKRDDFDLLAKKLKNQTATIKKLTESEKVHTPQGLYSLTDLQRRANMEFGFSALNTLEYAQTLYEKYKCLSYPRSDSKVMATSSFELVSDLVYRFKESYPHYFKKFAPYKVSLKNKIIFDDSRLTDHHGLIPLKEFTGIKDSPEGKIYDLVLKRFISNFLENFKFLETEVEISCEGEFFKTKGRQIIELGFKVLEARESENILPAIQIHEEGKLIKSVVESKKTKPPAEYNEASLLYDMTNPARLVKENDHKKIFRTEIGIGTQATRAQIIETLLKRNYITRSQKNLLATAKGIFLIDKLNVLPSTKNLTSIAQTADLELMLQEMSEGQKSSTGDGNFLDLIKNSILDAVLEWRNLQSETNSKKQQGTSLGACPICQAEIMSFPKSYSCSRWREGCKFTIWKVMAKKTISKTQVELIIAHKKSALIKGFKSKSGNSFDAYLVINQEGVVVFEFNN